MKFQSRSFVETNLYRPKPLIQFDESSDLILILTPWGKVSNGEAVLNQITQPLIGNNFDSEATTPFKRITTLSPQSNALRTSVLNMNDLIYKSQNKSEYLVGFEIFIGVKKDQSFSFISYGHPHVLLSRSGKTILPITTNIDHTLDLQTTDRTLPPLPNSLVGAQPTIECQVYNFVPQPGDQLLLLNRSWVSENILKLKSKDRNFETICKTLIEKDESSFWFGLLEF